MFTEYGIQLGPLDIRYYALIIITGALLALYLATKEAKKFGANSEVIFDLFFIVMFTGIIGARIYYVLFSPAQFIADPISIFKIWEGGIAIYGAIIAGSIASIFFAKKRGIRIPVLADIIFPVLMLAQSIGRWGNFVNVEAYGGPVPGANLAEQTAFLKQFFIPDFILDKMVINGVLHHPTFLYESLWNIVGFLLIYLVIRNFKKLYLGLLTCSYFIWYGIGRFMIEGMRTDSLYIGGGTSGIRVSQVVSIILIVAGVAGVTYILKRKKDATLYKDARFYLDGHTDAEVEG